MCVLEKADTSTTAVSMSTATKPHTHKLRSARRRANLSAEALAEMAEDEASVDDELALGSRERAAQHPRELVHWRKNRRRQRACVCQEHVDCLEVMWQKECACVCSVA
eukprot:1010567-Rhodomonas_salina.1